MVQQKVVWVGIVAILSLFISAQLFAQSDVIKQRQKLMKSNSAATKALKKAFAQGDYATVKAKANVIAGNMDKVQALFPKGSTSDKSRAKPVIWEKWDQFSKEPAKVKAAARELAEVAATKDEMRVGEKFVAFGMACGKCHKTFRGPRKKKK
ncbi:MAG: c-type cytochrome [Candidatus Binatia bacterium]